MSSWPILSLITFLPLVGVFFCLVVNGPAWPDIARHLLSLK